MGTRWATRRTWHDRSRHPSICGDFPPWVRNGVFPPRNGVISASEYPIPACTGAMWAAMSDQERLWRIVPTRARHGATVRERAPTVGRPGDGPATPTGSRHGSGAKWVPSRSPEASQVGELRRMPRVRRSGTSRRVSGRCGGSRRARSWPGRFCKPQVAGSIPAASLNLRRTPETSLQLCCNSFDPNPYLRRSG